MLKYGDGIIQMPQIDPEANPVSTLRQTQSVQKLGDFAHQTLETQFQYILAQEHGVIEDIDPEYLHQMRVGFRKLQAASNMFKDVIKCPPGCSKDSKLVLKRLGALRDLDVQLQGLTTKIKQASTPGKQRSLIRLQRDLKPVRAKVYKQVYKTLSKGHPYQNFKREMRGWLEHPKYQAIASLPVNYCAPELLSPWMSRLLLHPAWLASPTTVTAKQLHTLHHLRKLCKQLRYQSEFFQDVYPKAFKIWIKEIKAIQSILGQLQDARVFEQLMSEYQGPSVSHNATVKGAETVSTTTQLEHSIDLPRNWQHLRQRYRDPTYRHQLHELILTPTP